jgi:hypothetical protein
MIGSKTFTIGSQDFLAGMTTAADSTDGGFSPETDAVNLVAQPGVLNAPAAPTDKSTNLTGDIIASCEDPQFSGVQRVFVATNGTFYTSNSAGDLTLARTDNTNTYAAGFTHAAGYAGSVFVTAKEKITKWTVDSSFNASFFSFTNTNVPHPVLPFAGNLYYGDKNLLLRQQGVAGTPTTILTLSSELCIVALGFDPASGQMLISTTTQLNISDSVPTINQIHVYDGASGNTTRAPYVDDMVCGLYPTATTVFAGFGKNLGYWTGSGVQQLRSLNVSNSSNELPYRQHFTNIGSTMYLVEKTQILAYGPITAGVAKVFYYAYKNNVNSNSITHVCNMGSGLLGIAFSSNKFYTFDTNSIASTNTQAFYSRFYEFDSEIWVREIWLYYKSAVSNNASPGNVYFNTESDSGFNTPYSLQNKSGASESIHKITGLDKKLSSTKLRLNLDTTIAGIRKIVVRFDPANM